jgi:hypothetical protein
MRSEPGPIERSADPVTVILVAALAAVIWPGVWFVIASNVYKRGSKSELCIVITLYDFGAAKLS